MRNCPRIIVSNPRHNQDRDSGSVGNRQPSSVASKLPLASPHTLHRRGPTRERTNARRHLLLPLCPPPSSVPALAHL